MSLQHHAPSLQLEHEGPDCRQVRGAEIRVEVVPAVRADGPPQQQLVRDGVMAFASAEGISEVFAK
eukprot:CAMPEP_0198556832 /NCGR_PEP_ID=MMETSP1462-20131121/87493_1 /TAXON_ID=1333877 /ORGANISM="Brandtodinium nutriculum, Strain RCC3387" /LENGTH=65 /DNA_ID=CAMNT_0044287589 /DNA_START=117 /DNA_END=314 /DNA_ORIENTATION=-